MALQHRINVLVRRLCAVLQGHPREVALRYIYCVDVTLSPQRSLCGVLTASQVWRSYDVTHITSHGVTYDVLLQR